MNFNVFPVRLKKIVLAVMAVLFLLPLASQAALLPTPTGSCPDTAPNCILGKCTVGGATAPGYELPCNFTLDDILQSGVNFINLILGIVGGLALLIFVYGGYQMLTSMGNPEGIKKGKDALTGAFIGLILILGAAIFVWFAGALLGAKVGIVESGTTGQISAGKAECGGKNDGDNCGPYEKCYKQVCVPACDYAAATTPSCLGFSCQPKIAGLKCAKGYCPGDDSYQCCIAKTQIEALKKQYPEVGNCLGAKEAEIKAEIQNGCCVDDPCQDMIVDEANTCSTGEWKPQPCSEIPECS